MVCDEGKGDGCGWKGSKKSRGESMPRDNQDVFENTTVGYIPIIHMSVDGRKIGGLRTHKKPK